MIVCNRCQGTSDVAAVEVTVRHVNSTRYDTPTRLADLCSDCRGQLADTIGTYGTTIVKPGEPAPAVAPVPPVMPTAKPFDAR